MLNWLNVNRRFLNKHAFAAEASQSRCWINSWINMFWCFKTRLSWFTKHEMMCGAPVLISYITESAAPGSADTAPSALCPRSCLPDSDGMPGRYNGQVWNLGHSWSGALPQSGPHVLQRRPGSHRGVRHNKRGESGGRFCVVCFQSAAPLSVTTVGLTFLVMRWGMGCSRLNGVKLDQK